MKNGSKMEFMGDHREVCPECGQRVRHEMRGGVRMGPVKSTIFDLIDANPDISMDALHDKLSDTRPISRQTLRSHINQIRSSLMSVNSGTKLITLSERDGSTNVTRLRLLEV